MLSIEITELRHFALKDISMLRLKKRGLSIPSPLNQYSAASLFACYKQQREKQHR